MVKQISDNKIYLLIKYIKSVLWRVAKRLSYIEDARCLKVNAVSLTDAEECRLQWGSGKLKCVFYRLMWKLILMNRFAVTRLEGVFITNVAERFLNSRKEWFHASEAACLPCGSVIAG